MEARHPAPGEDANLAGLPARLQLELELALQRRDDDLPAERRLGHRQVDGREQVVALAHEARVRLHMDEDVEIARLGAELARVPLAADPDALTVVDSGRDLHRERALLDHAAGTVARAARVLDHPAGATATAAGARPDELPEDGVRDLLEPAAAPARGTGHSCGPGLGAAARAGPARDGDPERDVALDPPRRLNELDLDLGRDVGAPGGTAPARADAEKVVAEERREEV